jgi:hypothetical protein
MDQKERELWADTRAKGKLRYIALNGIIISGGLYAMGLTITGYFIEHGFDFSQVIAYATSTTTHTRFFLFATAFGSIWGLIKWNRGERAFAESLAKESAEPV